MQDVQLGMRVFKTSDPALNRALRQSFEGDIPIRKQRKLDLHVTGAAGRAAAGAAGNNVVTSTMPLQVAMKRPLTPGSFIEQFSRLGGTEFELGEVQFDVVGEVMLPISELNRMRRDLIAEWSEGASTAAPAVQITETLESLMPSRGIADDSQPLQLHALCRTQAHIDAALVLGVPRLYLDFEDIRLYADLVKQIKARSDTAQVWLATPRIQKSGEAGFFNSFSGRSRMWVLIRNLGAMSFFKDAGIPMTGDFSLNVAKPLTAEI